MSYRQFSVKFTNFRSGLAVPRIHEPNLCVAYIMCTLCMDNGKALDEKYTSRIKITKTNTNEKFRVPCLLWRQEGQSRPQHQIKVRIKGFFS